MVRKSVSHCSPFGADSIFGMVGSFQRRRDDSKNKIFAFWGGGALGAEREIAQNAVFRGKRHDNKILKLQILLSRNLVVIAQAPVLWVGKSRRYAEEERLVRSNILSGLVAGNSTTCGRLAALILGKIQRVKTLRAKGTLVSEPRFSTPCEMRFFPREKGKTAFSRKTLDKGHFPFLAWEKSHLAGGRKSGLTN